MEIYRKYPLNHALSMILEISTFAFRSGPIDEKPGLSSDREVLQARRFAECFLQMGGIERKPVLYVTPALFAGSSVSSEEIGHISQSGSRRFELIFKKAWFYTLYTRR